MQAVNAILKKVGQIHGDSSALVTLTSASRQRTIDLAIQAVNEGIDELYSIGGIPLPNEQAEGTITLVTGTRSYALASDLILLRYPFIDQTNTQYINPFPGGYNSIIQADPERNDTGLPHWGAISPVNGQFYLDRSPTSVENGNIYTYQYDKELEMTVTTDTVPFKDVVFRAMVPAWAQLVRRDVQNEFDAGLYSMGVGRAARLMTQVQPRDDYSPRRGDGRHGYAPE